MTSTRPTTQPSTTSRVTEVARRALPELALSAWTLFVWVGRLRNIAEDDTLTGWGLAWRAGLSSTFVGLALALLVAVFWRPTATRYAALALAAFGTVVWTVRGMDIALGDHSAAFIAVHVVLAVVTIGLSIIVARRWLPRQAA